MKGKNTKEEGICGKGGAVQTLSQGKTSNLLQEMSRTYTM